MTPKEQAEQLVEKYVEISVNLRQATTWEYDKQCALIAVETVILNCYEEEEYYWQEVKQEIEKL